MSALRHTITRAVLCAFFAQVKGTLAAEASDVDETVMVQRGQANALVTYAPAAIGFVDASGKGAKPDKISLGGGKYLLTGRLAITPSEGQLKTVKNAVTDLGSVRSEVKKLEPEEFALWLYRGRELVFSRPPAGGSLTSIPLQVMILPKPGDEKLGLTVVVGYWWTESVPPQNVLLDIDWKKVDGKIQEETRTRGAITDTQLNSTILALFQAKAIKFSVVNGGALDDFHQVNSRWLPIIKKHLLNSLLIVHQPAPSATGQPESGKPDPAQASQAWDLEYKLKTEVSVNEVRETLNLATGSYAQRFMMFSRPLPLD